MVEVTIFKVQNNFEFRQVTHTEDVAEKIIGSLKDFVCEQQEKLISFQAIAQQKHKALRMEITKDPANYDIDKIFEAWNAFETSVNSPYEAILYNCIDFLEEAICSREEGGAKGRVVKMSLAINKQGETIAMDFIRHDRNPRYKGGVVVEGNTGFEKVLMSREAFICNNIPKAVCDENYKNPRIRTDEVLGYCQKNGFIDGIISWFRLRNLTQQDDEWKSFWEPYPDTDEALTIQQCYRTSMVIPIALTRDPANDQLAEYLRRRKQDSNRPIFGFLCFDHKNAEFFNETDKNIGFIVADIIAILMFNRYMLTDWSKTYTKCLELLTNANKLEPT